MKVKLDQISGEIMKDNETYVLEDNNFRADELDCYLR
jgi:hypothetical protein